MRSACSAIMQTDWPQRCVRWSASYRINRDISFTMPHILQGTQRSMTETGRILSDLARLEDPGRSTDAAAQSQAERIRETDRRIGLFRKEMQKASQEASVSSTERGLQALDELSLSFIEGSVATEPLIDSADRRKSSACDLNRNSIHRHRCCSVRANLTVKSPSRRFVLESMSSPATAMKAHRPCRWRYDRRGVAKARNSATQVNVRM